MATGRVPTTANSPLTAKGDLFTYDTSQARLAVGNNGDTLVADSSASTGLRWQGNFAAGKNKILNSDFSIWQRGTSFSPAADVGTFTADRFIFQRNGSGYTATCSRQTFTAGTAPVAGYEGQFFWRYAVTVAGTSNTYAVLDQRIEDVRTLAGQTATVSFWGKADTTRTVNASYTQEFGSGGSAQVGTSLGSFSFTTSWQRFSATISVPSVSGKTIGTNSYCILRFDLPSGAITPTIDLWGVQVEASNTATAFQTATGTLAGELAACQRYYYRTATGTAYQLYAFGPAKSTTAVFGTLYPPVTMRATPTSVDFANLALTDGFNAPTVVTGATLNGSLNSSVNCAQIDFNVSSGLTQYRFYTVTNNNSTSGFLGISAEL